MKGKVFAEMAQTATGKRKLKSGKGDAGRKRTLPECEGCPALCCHDLVMPIEKPKTRDDIDELKWKLQYDTVRVFIRNYRWYLLIKGRCIYLDKDNFCTIYDRRPKRCREHKPPDCERYGPFYDVMISTPEELEEYLNGHRKRK